MFQLNDIHIESTTACNSHCIMCPHSDMTRAGTMKYDLFKKIVDDAVDLGTQRITPFRVGEPFLFKDLYIWLDYLKTKPVVISLFTNGSLLTKEDALKLEKYMPNLAITISFHGYDKQSYEAITGMNFENSRNHVIEFVSNIQSIPVIIYCLLQPEDNDKAHLVQELWKDYKFHGVGVANFMEWAGKRKIGKTKLDFMNEKPLSYKRVPCDYVLHHIDVMYDGRVCLCCVDSNGEIIFGDLNKQTITEVVNSKLYQYWIAEHERNGGTNLPLCSQCSINIEDLFTSG